MAFNQTRDVLNHVRQYHLRLSRLYEDLKPSAVSESARGLLDYLSRHERHIETCMVMYEEQVSENVLDTYFKYESESTHMSKIEEFERKPAMDVSDITAAAMYFNTCLVSFCREMAERALSEKVREVFDNMLKMEVHEQHRLSMQLLEMV